MEAAMKASNGDEGDGEGDSGGGRAKVTRVEGKGRWQGGKSSDGKVAGDEEDEGVEEGNESFYS